MEEEEEKEVEEEDEDAAADDGDAATDDDESVKTHLYVTKVFTIKIRTTTPDSTLET